MRYARIFAAVLSWLILATNVRAQTPPYSTPPIIQAFQTTNLTVPYTIGLVTSGGSQQVVGPGSVTLVDNMNSCQAPSYAACNFIYWAGGTQLVTTNVPSAAFQGGNTIIAFVTTSGGTVANVVYFSQAAQQSDNLLPAGVSTVLSPAGIRLPLCNALRTYSVYSGCQVSTGSLSGY